MATIEHCDCKHDGQDKLHGKGKRVHNTRSEKNRNAGNGRSRCTVCSRVKQ